MSIISRFRKDKHNGPDDGANPSANGPGTALMRQRPQAPSPRFDALNAPPIQHDFVDPRSLVARGGADPRLALGRSGAQDGFTRELPRVDAVTSEMPKVNPASIARPTAAQMRPVEWRPPARPAQDDPMDPSRLEPIRRRTAPQCLPARVPGAQRARVLLSSPPDPEHDCRTVDERVRDVRALESWTDGWWQYAEAREARIDANLRAFGERWRRFDESVAASRAAQASTDLAAAYDEGGTEQYLNLAAQVRLRIAQDAGYGPEPAATVGGAL